MINLVPFNKKDCFDSHLDIVRSKRDPLLVTELLQVSTFLEPQFRLHQLESITNTLENINPLVLENSVKDKLRNLYKLKSRAVVEVRQTVTTNTEHRAINECQYCTINSVSSMDHIMPKTLFPEFSVNTQNLFPCCGECNAYKSDIWLINEERQFLNLYLDILPNRRYLFVELEYQNDIIYPRFYIENSNGIDETEFQLISNHYNRLHLCERFSQASHSIISELKSILTSLPRRLNLDETRSFILEVTSREMEYHGANYWKSILQIALSEDEIFLESCEVV